MSYFSLRANFAIKICLNKKKKISLFMMVESYLISMLCFLRDRIFNKHMVRTASS